MKKVFTKILATMILLSVATLTMSSACSRDDDDITNNSSNSRRNPSYNIITLDGNTYYADFDEDYLAYYYIHGLNGLTSKSYDFMLMDERYLHYGEIAELADRDVVSFGFFTADINDASSNKCPAFNFEYTYNHSTPRVGDDFASFTDFEIWTINLEKDSGYEFPEYVSGSAKVTKISKFENSSKFSAFLTIVFDHLTMRCKHGEHVLNGKVVIPFSNTFRF